MGKPLTIGDVMTKSPFEIDRHALVSEAIKVMYAKGINHLPVTSKGILYGIISDRDTKLAKAVIAADKFSALRVEEICNQDPYVAQVDEPLADVAKAMIDRKIGSALVAKGGVIAGIFTVTDALQTIIKLAKN